MILIAYSDRPHRELQNELCFDSKAQGLHFIEFSLPRKKQRETKAHKAETRKSSHVYDVGKNLGAEKRFRTSECAQSIPC